MSIRTSPWPAGVPCWADAGLPDVAAAQDFYAAVLGWDFAQTGEEYGGYTIAQVAGAPAAGIGPQQEGAPPAWTVYFASHDADATASAIAAAGGTVMVPPMDVGPLGRMCIAGDPTGAVFGVWQAGEHIGASVVNEPGGIMWEDLRTSDPAAAHAFYATVFGHHIDPMPEAAEDYATFRRPDEEWPLGGMGGMAEAPPGTPPHWVVYFTVADADAATAAAEAGGGRVLAPAFDTPYGRMACLADPWGAVFWVTQPQPDAPQPDRAG
jgi:uncharacterized protein